MGRKGTSPNVAGRNAPARIGGGEQGEKADGNWRLEENLPQEFLNFLPSKLLDDPRTPAYLLNNPDGGGKPAARVEVGSGGNARTTPDGGFGSAPPGPGTKPRVVLRPRPVSLLEGAQGITEDALRENLIGLIRCDDAVSACIHDEFSPSPGSTRRVVASGSVLELPRCGFSNSAAKE